MDFTDFGLEQIHDKEHIRLFSDIVGMLCR
jgi:hypothetical protein